MSMSDTSNLEDGFYWVRNDLAWAVAERVSTAAGRAVWFLAGDDRLHLDSDFDEIDPRPIKRAE